MIIFPLAQNIILTIRYQTVYIQDCNIIFTRQNGFFNISGDDAFTDPLAGMTDKCNRYNNP